VVIAPLRITRSNNKNSIEIGMIQIFRDTIEKLGWELAGGSVETHKKPWQAAK